MSAFLFCIYTLGKWIAGATAVIGCFAIVIHLAISEPEFVHPTAAVAAKSLCEEKPKKPDFCK